ncbi:Actin-depolymerizing factor gmf1 [Escovopsis weberi]|uniref:Actin-depolymerizing factor gmf1 n=1 Tax=Escovopsis weberi TaxID=150374 RepID=A0A0M8N0I1_ESCWE|nr:Actin-depolymerizing factor gmf1 [Escovopsis weberi]
MASESRLFKFSGETKAFLQKFRLTTSRAKGPQAVVFLIDKVTYEVRQDDDQTVYDNLDELCDELPDHAPRYVLLSYPLTKSDGRAACPYVMLYYLPVTCNAEAKMLYAGAKELMRNTSEVGKVIDFPSKDDIDDIIASLKAD